MSLKKKIIISFILSAAIIAILSIFLFLNFSEIRTETVFLEMTDTIRSKSLQLRRHEKNYFLYAPEKAGGEIAAIRQYLDELDGVLDIMENEKPNRGLGLRKLVREYREQFGNIEVLVGSASGESKKLEARSPAYQKVHRLVEANFLDKPLEDVNYLQEQFGLRSDHRFILWLKELDAGISSLRKTGEAILIASKELDTAAREKVDSFNKRSRYAVLIAVPIFLVVGFGLFLFVVGNIVKRLELLTRVVEKAGEGLFAPLPVSPGKWTEHDEVETLIQKFNIMEEHIVSREKELLQSKKLAAIGTLAAGVAHELNNPLNNIYTTAQRLMKKTGVDSPEYLTKGLDAIFGESLRVKRIVGDLLTFARGRELNLRPVELRSLIAGVIKHLGDPAGADKIRYDTAYTPEEIVVYADQVQLEQVFINLFTNAADAMNGAGTLTVKAKETEQQVIITVSDTGAGMSRETLEKVFEPFYTTKNKGTGLGLAIVFNIIQKHNGTIQVASEEGQGTTFTITLPKSEGTNRA